MIFFILYCYYFIIVIKKIGIDMSSIDFNNENYTFPAGHPFEPFEESKEQEDFSNCNSLSQNISSPTLASSGSSKVQKMVAAAGSFSFGQVFNKYRLDCEMDNNPINRIPLCFNRRIPETISVPFDALKAIFPKKEAALKASNKSFDILTGKIILGEEIPKDPELQTLYHASAVALDILSQQSIVSFLYMNRAGISHDTVDDHVKERGVLFKALNKIRQNTIDYPIDKQVYEKRLRLCVERGVGNCEEMTSLFIQHMKTQYPGIKVESCFYENGNHVFAEVGGKLYVDPWAGSIGLVEGPRDKPRNFITYAAYVDPTTNKVVSAPIVERTDEPVTYSQIPD